MLSMLYPTYGLALPFFPGQDSDTRDLDSSDPSSGRWLDLVAAASAGAALGLTGWTGARRVRRKGPKTSPLTVNWAEDDSVSSLD